VLSAAGARFTQAVAGKRGNYAELSVERMDRIADADAIAVYAENDGSLQSFQRANPLNDADVQAAPRGTRRARVRLRASVSAELRRGARRARRSFRVRS
jgi:hypothetical protein